MKFVVATVVSRCVLGSASSESSQAPSPVAGYEMTLK
jgi:hypothetical protein